MSILTNLLAEPSFILLLLTLLRIHYSTQQVSALSCYCDPCPAETCTTTPDTESVCFKSIARRQIQDRGPYALEFQYGCFSGGSLAPLQCYANKLNHREFRYISCCKDQDYCNENLPDPKELDNFKNETYHEIEAPIDTNIKIAIIFTSIATAAFIIFAYALFRFALFLCAKYSAQRSKDIEGSICSLKADLDKFHHHHVSSSSASTKSYSISDDLCHKMPERSNEHSFSPEDLTSGLGERMLNQRTMARAVGFGKTDHVGNGRFGRVFRGEYHGEDVAVKAFRTIDQESWKREDTIFRTLNHDNIVRFIASEVTCLENGATEIWMFLEYCPYGSLCDYLDHNEIYGPQQAIKILYSIINGLNYLHEDYAQASKLYKPSIAHRDIKSKNILMKTPYCCCIADFGHALIKVSEETLDRGRYDHKLQVGTIRYMAPEILREVQNLNYGHFSTFAQADLYQYGLILWEVCHRTALDILHPAGEHKLPYDGVVPLNPDIQDMIKIVCDDQYRPPRYDKWEKYPMMKRLTDLMPECWRPNPKARMETLGVKKKLREIHDQVAPGYKQQYQLNLFNNFSKSSDVTM